MTYARRSTVRQGALRVAPDPPLPGDTYDLVAGGVNYLVFNLSQPAFFSAGQATTAIVIWGNGLISLGPVTAAQIQFMSTYAGPAQSLSGFPGDFYAPAGSATAFSAISIFTEADGDLARITWRDSEDQALGTLNVNYSTGPGDLADIYFVQTGTGFEVSYQAGDGIYHSGAPAPDNPGGPPPAGTEGDDFLAAAPSGQVLNGNGGDDVLFGDIGNDVLNGGNDDDYLYGAGGNDMLDGGAGDDTLYHDDGIETLSGGSGSDILIIDWSFVDSAATLQTGFIIDLNGGASGQASTADGRSVEFSSIEQFQLFTGDQGDTIHSDAGDDVIVTNGGNDTVLAGDGADIVYGGGGDDTINADGGDDFLQTDAGSDELNGGDGSDTLEIAWLQYGGMFIQEFLTASPQGGFDGAFGTGDFQAEVSFTSIERFRIFSGAFDDMIQTGDGNDEFVTGAGNDEVLAGGGNDMVFGGLGDDELYGEAGDDLLQSDAGDDMLDGEAGFDRLQLDWQQAGAAFLEVPLTPNGGIGYAGRFASSDGRHVSFLSIEQFSITTGAMNDVIATGDNGDYIDGGGGNDRLDGGGGFDRLFGGSGNDELVGGGGNDMLEGGLGADVMDGGLGDDRFYLDNVLDRVIEASGGGNDIILSAVSYVLADGVFVESIATTNNAGTAAINLTGNSLANSMSGNAGANILNGGAGADVMQGFGGNDRYYVDNVLDRVVEGSGGGTDIVLTSVSYVLAESANVESLATTNLAGTGAINLTGNGLANNMSGNAGANLLNGGGGNDAIQALGGNDILNGGAGADAMDGGAGDDRFYIDNVSDRVIEASGGGNDILLASVSYVLAESAFVESLATTDNAGTAAINLTGNSLANIMSGNAGANILNGGGGADIMQGLGGNDRYYVDNALDRVIEASGGGSDLLLASVSYTVSDSVFVEALATTNAAGAGAIDLAGNALDNNITGNAGANSLNGNGGNDSLVGLGGNDILQGGLGNDSLFGGLGADSLTGGAGADLFRFDSALGAGNVDTITDFAVVDDTILLENAVFTGLAAGALAPGAFVTGTAAADADDRIIYNSATGALLFDADGVGGVAAIQFATLQTGLALTAGDFVVI